VDKIAAYDEIADWYVGWVRDDPGLMVGRPSPLVPERLDGHRVLDAACGQGRVARGLARRGAAVVGVDLSARLVAAAREAETAAPLGVDYRVGDLADPEDWWDGMPFDGAVCALALMDIADLDGALAGVARALRPGGWFVTSLVHPCYPGSATGLSSWPPDRGYAAEGWWTSPDHNPGGARIRIGSYHRTLATYLNALGDAGLPLARAHEPPDALPRYLVLACRRATSPRPPG
jgi:SAM-dependent methyltransferase